MEFKIQERVLRPLNLKLPNGEFVLKHYDNDNCTAICKYGGKFFEVPGPTTVFLRATISRTSKRYAVLWLINGEEFTIWLNEVRPASPDGRPFQRVEDENEYNELLKFAHDNALDRIDTTTEVPYVVEEDPMGFHR